MEKTAFVLSGGGSRGAYEIGVWRALYELGEAPRIVTGSSVGALNGAMVAQGDYEVAEALWKELETARIFSLPVREDSAPGQRRRDILRGFSAAAMSKGGLDPAPLEKLLRQYIDEDRVRRSPVRLGLVTFRVNDIRPQYLWVDELPEGLLHDYLLASSALFPAVRPRKIGRGQYIDGAFADNMPVQMALSAGANRVIAVQLDAPGLLRKVRREDGISLRVIRSWWDLGSILMFDPCSARQNIRLGYLDAMRAFGVYDGCAYALIKGGADRLLHTRYLPAAEKLFPLYCGSAHSRKLPGVLQKRLRRRGLERKGALRALALDGMECAGELFGVDPSVLYSFERFEQRLHTAVDAVRRPPVKRPAEDGGSASAKVLLAGKQAAAISYAIRLAPWLHAFHGDRTSACPPPAPPGMAVGLVGGLARGDTGFAAAVYLALSGIC